MADTKNFHTLRHLLTLIVASLVVGFSPTSAYAELYQYEDAAGNVIITNNKRSDLKLIHVIEEPKRSNSSTNSNSSSSSSSKGGSKISPSRAQKFEAYREEANQALAESTANHDVPSDLESRSSFFDDIIEEAAQEYDLPFAFIKAVIRIESGFRPDVISHAGAMGLMQLMPRTAELMNVQDPFDPRENIFGGTKYLRLLCNRYEGNINLILAAYNAGDGAVARYNGIPYPQTRDYVKKIDTWYRIYSSQDREKTP